MTVVFGVRFCGTKGYVLPEQSPPLIVFCSPPFDFYVDRNAEMLEANHPLMQLATCHHLVVEADERFDFATLADAPQWDIRSYPPASSALWEKPLSNTSS